MIDLVERLRQRTVFIDGKSDGRGGWYRHEESDPLCNAAADALEAKDKLIAELEARITELEVLLEEESAAVDNYHNLA